MTWTQPQAFGKNTQTAATSLSVTSTNPVTAGSLLVCFAETHGAVVTCSDNLNGTWAASTDYANIPGSSKHYAFFWVLSAAAGSTTVTISGMSSGTQYMQCVEFSLTTGTHAIDTTPVNATGSSATASATSGTPTATGDIMVLGVATNTEGNKNFTATSPWTLTGTCGSTNGLATAGMAAHNVGTGPQTASMGINASDGWGAIIMGFQSPTAVAGPKGSFFPFF